MNGKTKLAALPHTYCLTEDADSALHRGQREFRTRHVGDLAAVGLEDRKVPSIFFFLLILILGDPGAGQSVGSGEKARRKFSSTGERVPGYRLSPNYFQKFKSMIDP